MDAIQNPFAPSAGTPPPELAGRDQLLAAAEVALARLERGKPTKGMLLVGLRGVGKTVLLDRMRQQAENHRIATLRIEAPENRSLPAILVPQLRATLIEISRDEKAKDVAVRALRAVAGFARSLKVKYGDIEISTDYEPEAGLADNGDLDHDLLVVLESAGHAAQRAGRGLAIFLDEMQYLKEIELGALVMALHRCAQQQLPVILFGAGLPQLAGLMGRAKSYAERLFDYPNVGPLDEVDVARALRIPVEAEGATIEPKAISKIFDVTEGYPYFVQQWGKFVWDHAPASTITEVDVDQVTPNAVASLDANFFRVRFDRLTPAEKRYLRAMAELGPGPHRSGDIANVLRRQVSSLGPTRARLIAKGMVWSPNHGDTAFSVPMFDGFMRRTMPLEAP